MLKMLLFLQEKKTKQVVMGKLGATDSFGEISVITKDPITCSIITADSVELASIDPARIEGRVNQNKSIKGNTKRHHSGHMGQTFLNSNNTNTASWVNSYMW